MLAGPRLYHTLCTLVGNMANILETVQDSSSEVFFFLKEKILRNHGKRVLERLMEDDSSQCDRRFFLPIKSSFHRRLISWGLAGPTNRELQWWQGCGQPRLSLPFNESSPVPSPITNLPAPWWIIIWEEKTSCVLNAHRQRAIFLCVCVWRPELITRACLWLRICFWCTGSRWGLFLALRQTDPLKRSPVICEDLSGLSGYQSPEETSAIDESFSSKSHSGLT